MTNINKIEYCSDIIAFYENKLVLIERLNFPTGLALPGGRRDIINGNLEDSVLCAMRELTEETGLQFNEINYFARYDSPSRDPRGHKISDIFYGSACGNITDEADKTRAILVDIVNLPAKKEFAFDHYNIIQDWIKYANIAGGFQ
jgi:ADP-ribose pyrophosphatase YjhB (NUDIX family)